MNMDKKTMFAIATVLLLAAAYGIYKYWQTNHPTPEIVQSKNTLPSLPTPPPVPVASQVTETPPAQPPLPQLAQSDSFVLDALADLVGNPSLMKLFHTDQIVHNIVVTVDNLPQQRVPDKVMPFKSPSGHFLTADSEDQLTVSPRNASRYAGYVSIAEAVDARKLVERRPGLPEQEFQRPTQ
jgi:Protein of unknown function (DUF3014)